jgi:hypothetical protein
MARASSPMPTSRSKPAVPLWSATRITFLRGVVDSPTLVESMLSEKAALLEGELKEREARCAALESGLRSGVRALDEISQRADQRSIRGIANGPSAALARSALLDNGGQG